jgi:GTP-binding protein Era
VSEGHRSGFIALIGRPNAGKSTLLNNLVGHKIAITSDKPQTTRNKILGILTGEGWQMVFLDTPGIHKPKDRLGEHMVRVSMNTLNEVDVIYYLIDVSVPFGGGDAFIMEKLKHVKTPVFLLLNKIDLLDKPRLLPLIDFYQKKGEWQEIVPVSALKGESIDSLLKTTIERIPPGPRYYPGEAVTDQPERVLAAEFIREKVIEATREEVPHSTAVEVEQMERRSEGLLYIGAVIYVERESQKGILIGKKGEMLKFIGSRARFDLERLFGNRVYLELWVKVKAGWRSKEKSLRELGYKDW